jgi:hypothetical protein
MGHHLNGHIEEVVVTLAPNYKLQQGLNTRLRTLAYDYGLFIYAAWIGYMHTGSYAFPDSSRAENAYK